MAMFDDFGKIPAIQPPKAPEKVEKTMGDMPTIIESQRLYNPQMPSVPKVKPPPAAQIEAGTAAKAGMTGNWGTNG
jgi:hypothetical protein